LEKDYGVIGEDDSVNYVDNGIDDIAADSTPAIIDTAADISQMQTENQNQKQTAQAADISQMQTENQNQKQTAQAAKPALL
jgi:hypothetical protein